MTAPLGFGGAPLGNLFAPIDEALARATLAAARDCGLRHFDTAPFYGMGLSEQRLGAMLREQPRETFTLSTKVGRLLTPDASAPREQHGYVNTLPMRVHYDYSREGALRSIDESLARLGLDRIDNVFIHDVGEDTHGAQWRAHYAQAIDGAARALGDLKRAGVIRGWGLGVNRIEPCLAALRDADPDCLLVAGRLSLLDDSALAELLPACQARKVGVFIGGPFNSGLLAGGDTFDYQAASTDLVARRNRIIVHCQRHGVDIKAAALQYCAAHPAVVGVLAGMRSPREVRENAAAMRAPIPAALWLALAEEGLIPRDHPVSKA